MILMKMYLVVDEHHMHRIHQNLYLSLNLYKVFVYIRLSQPTAWPQFSKTWAQSAYVKIFATCMCYFLCDKNAVFVTKPLF